MSNNSKIEEIGIILDQISQDIEALKEDDKIGPARWEELILAAESIKCKINSLYLEQIELSLSELKSLKSKSKTDISENDCSLTSFSVNDHKKEKETVAIDDEEEFEFFPDSGESILDVARGKKPAWMTDIPGPKITDITDGITLNDKLLYIKELFNGDEQQYRLSLQKINEMTSLEEVMDYTKNAFPDWDENSSSVYRFYMNIRRKFNGKTIHSAYAYRKS